MLTCRSLGTGCDALAGLQTIDVFLDVAPADAAGTTNVYDRQLAGGEQLVDRASPDAERSGRLRDGEEDDSGVVHAPLPGCVAPKFDTIRAIRWPDRDLAGSRPGPRGSRQRT